MAGGILDTSSRKAGQPLLGPKSPLLGPQVCPQKHPPLGTHRQLGQVGAVEATLQAPLGVKDSEHAWVQLCKHAAPRGALTLLHGPLPMPNTRHRPHAQDDRQVRLQTMLQGCASAPVQKEQAGRRRAGGPEQAGQTLPHSTADRGQRREERCCHRAHGAKDRGWFFQRPVSSLP